MGTFSDECGSCRFLDINDWSGSKHICKCTLRGQYHSIYEQKCYKHEPAVRRDYYDLENRWYIVTTIFNKLGLNKSYDCVNTLLTFRVNVLERDPKYNDTLAEYDIVGPKISEELMNDIDSVKLSKRLLQVYLVRVLDLIRDKKNDEALNIYLEMVNFLKVIYETKFVNSFKK